MSFLLGIDWRQFGEGLDRVSTGLSAVLGTVVASGAGEVVVSIRKKLPHERGKGKAKVPHGRLIANILREAGHDPFDYPDETAREVQEFVISELGGVISDAYRTGRPKVRDAQGVLRAGAEFLAESARERITSGGLGRSVGGYGKRKAIMANQGRLGVTKKYGNPPPVGVFTGRFAEGIRHRWRRGRRSLSG